MIVPLFLLKKLWVILEIKNNNYKLISIEEIFDKYPKIVEFAISPIVSIVGFNKSNKYLFVADLPCLSTAYTDIELNCSNTNDSPVLDTANAKINLSGNL